MVLWKYDGILLIIVSPKTMENTNGCYNNNNNNNNNSKKIFSCFKYHVLRSVIISAKTAEQLKLVERKQSGFFIVSKFHYRYKSCSFLKNWQERMTDAKPAKSLYSNRIGNSLIRNTVPEVSFYFSYMILAFISEWVNVYDSGGYLQLDLYL